MNELVAGNNFIANEGRAPFYTVTNNLVATQVAVERKSVGFDREGSTPSIPSETLKLFHSNKTQLLLLYWREKKKVNHFKPLVSH